MRLRSRGGSIHMAPPAFGPGKTTHWRIRPPFSLESDMAVYERLRSALFVPATRPERFAKALASGADAVIIDLEDAVERDAKDQARKNLAQFSSENRGVRFLVRINDAGAPWFNADLALCGELSSVVGIMLPKAESAQQIADVSATGKPVFPLIESAQGVHAMGAIAGAEGVSRLSFGILDLMLDMGVAPDTPAAAILLNQVRFNILLQSRVDRKSTRLNSSH